VIALGDAQRAVLELVVPTRHHEVDLNDGLGSIVAADIHARDSVPPFDVSAMDGYAMRAADTINAPVTLRELGSVAAGDAREHTIGSGEAIRIMTGGPVPTGANAVVLVERTRGDGRSVVIEIPVAPGTAIRPMGEDVRTGDTVARTGDLLTPGRLGLLASAGVATVPVRRRPKVGIISTGDELVDGPIRPEGKIYDANRVSVAALVAEAGCMAIDFGISTDDESRLASVLQRATESCDAVVTTGGVSVGDFDYMHRVLDRIGDVETMQIAIKPAKPFALGAVIGTPVFGLPGNPVAAMVSFELLVRPALLKMAGHAQLDRLRITAEAAEDFDRRADGKIHFVRAVATQPAGRWLVRSAGGQGSHQLSAMAAANALVVLDGPDGVHEGEQVPVMLLNWR
jgi:molybdopterin molybdotransferase